MKVFDDINNLAEAAKETALAAKEREKTANETAARYKSEIDELSSLIVQGNSIEKKANPSQVDLDSPNPKWERNTEEIKIREEDLYMITMQSFEQNQFARAEEILSTRAPSLSNLEKLKRYLPHTLLLQEKTEDAKDAYL